MRRSLFFILLATAAMPALATAQDRDSRGFGLRGERAERTEQSESGASESSQRAQRATRSDRAERGAEPGAERGERIRAPRAERTQRSVESSNQPISRSPNEFFGRRNRTGSSQQDGTQSTTAVTRDSTESVTNWRSRERRVMRSADSPTTTRSTTSGFGLRGDGSPTNWGDRTRNNPNVTTGTRSTSWRDRDRDDHSRRWSGHWRNDHRYNWRHHRNRHSSLFRLGRYYDPFGYGYRRFSIGLFLGSGYYRNNNYWLNDPWQYRLPAAYGPYRWIRYYNDALLVNVYSGEVVDVINGFFW